MIGPALLEKAFGMPGTAVSGMECPAAAWRAKQAAGACRRAAGGRRIRQLRAFWGDEG